MSDGEAYPLPRHDTLSACLLEAADARLRKLGVNTSKPGFYDQPAFLAAEKTDPALLEAYADFVEERVHSKDYLASAERAVEQTTTFLYERLLADGRKGACVDISLVLSQFLERQGIWNYLVKGALTVVFPPSSGFDPRYFCPLTFGNNPAVTGHAWVCAPPFRIVDLTLTMQPYTGGEEKYLDGPVLAKSGRPTSVTAVDLFDSPPPGYPYPTLKDAQESDPTLLKRIKRYGAIEVPVRHTRLRYFACSPSAPDLPLEKARNLNLSGKWPIELWNDFEKTRGG